MFPLAGIPSPSTGSCSSAAHEAITLNSAKLARPLGLLGYALNYLGAAQPHREPMGQLTGPAAARVPEHVRVRGFFPAISTVVAPRPLGHERTFQRSRKCALGLFYQSMLIPLNEVANAEETGEGQDEDYSGNSVMQLEQELPKEVTAEAERCGPQNSASSGCKKKVPPTHPVHACEEGGKMRRRATNRPRKTTMPPCSRKRYCPSLIRGADIPMCRP